MQQYIDRCQLLNKQAVMRFYRKHSNPARSFTVEDCLGIVRQFPAVPVWIPVQERLPQPETEILCAFDNGEVCSLWQDWSLSQDEDPFLYGEEADFSHTRRATHWMPLPPAPGKGGAVCPTTM